MSAKFVLDEICAVLDTYKGRDKFLRTICYTSKLIGGLTSDPVLAKKWFIVSSKMSGTRAVLRLLDDLPMLKYTLEYGLGKSEPDNFIRTLNVVANGLDQLYYPIEKMSWLYEHNLINGSDGGFWDTLSSWFWVVSIYLGLMSNLRYVSILEKHKDCIQKDESR